MEEPIHSDAPGGIFIPYDKLLQQQSEKLDKILDELREMDKRKLDIVVFESFRSSYENRHEALKTKADNIERSLFDPALIKDNFETFRGDIDGLQKYKAEQEAVKAQTRYWLGGGAIVGLVVLINLVLTLFQIANGTAL